MANGKRRWLFATRHSLFARLSFPQDSEGGNTMAELATVAKTDTPINVRRVGAFLGAEVTGIDLAKPLPPETVEAIRLAHATHEVLVFPDQKIGSDDLKRFGRCFGELTVHPFSTNAADAPELIV